MPIKNYTTKIGVFESLGEIQGALARNGARKIMVDYDDRGRPVGITFGLQTVQGDVLFQMTGKMSITADTEDNQLEIVVEDENGEYKKHFIGLSDNVTYVVEDVTSKDVNQYKYTLNFNPKMWLPEISTIE